VGDWVIEEQGTVAATGGIYFHYNVPYGDLFMEVAEPFRRRGYGSYLIQELKRVCYEMGRIPAARLRCHQCGFPSDSAKGGSLALRRIVSGVLVA